MNFFKIYIFCLCVTLAIGVASYTTAYPYVYRITNIAQLQNEIQTQVNALNNQSNGLLGNVGAMLDLIKTSLQLVFTMLISAPMLVQKTIEMLGLPPELAFPIYVMNAIAFAGTVYNLIRGFRAVRW